MLTFERFEIFNGEVCSGTLFSRCCTTWKRWLRFWEGVVGTLGLLWIIAFLITSVCMCDLGVGETTCYLLFVSINYCKEGTKHFFFIAARYRSLSISLSLCLSILLIFVKIILPRVRGMKIESPVRSRVYCTSFSKILRLEITNDILCSSHIRSLV